MSKNTHVVIGCKHPSGVILEFGAPGQSGYRKIVLKGANEGQIRSDGLFIPQTVGGFGKTNVPADQWDAWKNGDGIVVSGSKDQPQGQAMQIARAARKALVEEWQASGTVFVVEDPDLALAQANEKAGVRTGFEPLDPTAKTTPGADGVHSGVHADPDALSQRLRDNFGAARA